MKLRIRKPSIKIEESLITPALEKQWRDPVRADSYLKKRFPYADCTGDFLKEINAVRLRDDR